jgi:hypothetical protein
MVDQTVALNVSCKSRVPDLYVEFAVEFELHDGTRLADPSWMSRKMQSFFAPIRPDL